MMKNVRGIDLKEGMQIHFDSGVVADVLMESNYYTHSHLCIVGYNHKTEKQEYIRVAENKKYTVDDHDETRKERQGND